MLANTKRCPACGVNIEKNQGCQHMTCSKCKHEFCWLCKGKWIGHNSCAVYTAADGSSKNNKSAMSKDAVEEEFKIQQAKNELQRYMHYYTRFDHHTKAVKFAQQTRAKSFERMFQLQKHKGAGLQDSDFVVQAVESVIRSHQTLRWVNVYEYYLEADKDSSQRLLIEAQHKQLESFNDRLHEISERDPAKLVDKNVRLECISLQRAIENYRNSLIKSIVQTTKSWAGLERQDSITSINEINTLKTKKEEEEDKQEGKKKKEKKKKTNS